MSRAVGQPVAPALLVPPLLPSEKRTPFTLRYTDPSLFLIAFLEVACPRLVSTKPQLRNFGFAIRLQIFYGKLSILTASTGQARIIICPLRYCKTTVMAVFLAYHFLEGREFREVSIGMHTHDDSDCLIPDAYQGREFREVSIGMHTHDDSDCLIPDAYQRCSLRVIFGYQRRDSRSDQELSPVEEDIELVLVDSTSDEELSQVEEASELSPGCSNTEQELSPDEEAIEVIPGDNMLDKELFSVDESIEVVAGDILSDQELSSVEEALEVNPGDSTCKEELSPVAEAQLMRSRPK
ncbi:hypothetical protein HGM15179_013665 [Zosterops borbonicus]|uniref:Uncharacterized protein n=1 Tax=Zosterops borbonicus TaxID=364589 RepID=A0A8K1G8M0_9PASS|nr:hypothetical protein HGM15179_013665 [Zosterops borbonicus]